jgi:hypothetical protein
MRDRIYEAALLCNAPLRLRSDRNPAVALLCVSKQVKNEVEERKPHFRENSFYVDAICGQRTLNFLHYERSIIQHVFFKDDESGTGGGTWAALKRLRYFNSLRTLTISGTNGPDDGFIIVIVASRKWLPQQCEVKLQGQFTDVIVRSFELQKEFMAGLSAVSVDCTFPK